MSSKANVNVSFASHEAARYACQKWHYSKCLPSGKLVKVGVWEEGCFTGVILFGRGANNRMAGAYGLSQAEAVELTRVALRNHVTPVTRLVRLSLKLLVSNCPGIRLVVSYADPKQGHHGGIYQGGNWIYAGRSQAQRELVIGGKFTHKRTAFARYGTASPDEIVKITGKQCVWSELEWKHIYLMPLDEDMRRQVEQLSKPYPKRVTSTDSSVAGDAGRCRRKCRGDSSEL